MKQTENYQLNQWEKPDRIMMEDFNADNAKIDAALYAQAQTLQTQLATAGASELIRSGVSTGNVTAIYLNTSGVNWGRYSLVVFSIAAPSGLSGAFASSAGGRYQSGGYPTWESGALMQLASVNSACALMPVGRSGDTHASIFGISNNTYFGMTNIPLKSISSFYFQSAAASVKLPAGTAFSMWGVR